MKRPASSSGTRRWRRKSPIRADRRDDRGIAQQNLGMNGHGRSSRRSGHAIDIEIDHSRNGAHFSALSDYGEWGLNEGLTGASLLKVLAWLVAAHCAAALYNFQCRLDLSQLPARAGHVSGRRLNSAGRRHRRGIGGGRSARCGLRACAAWNGAWRCGAVDHGVRTAIRPDQFVCQAMRGFDQRLVAEPGGRSDRRHRAEEAVNGLAHVNQRQQQDFRHRTLWPFAAFAT